MKGRGFAHSCFVLSLLSSSLACLSSCRRVELTNAAMLATPLQSSNQIAGTNLVRTDLDMALAGRDALSISLQDRLTRVKPPPSRPVQGKVIELGVDENGL